MFVPLLIWWMVVDKKRLFEISAVGFAAWITATYLDLIGISFSFWTYGHEVIQMIDPLNPVDMSILPSMYMMIYQWFPKWKRYVFALIVMAGVVSFVAEPVFVWMKKYHLTPTPSI